MRSAPVRIIMSIQNLLPSVGSEETLELLNATEGGQSDVLLVERLLQLVLSKLSDLLI